MNAITCYYKYLYDGMGVCRVKAHYRAGRLYCLIGKSMSSTLHSRYMHQGTKKAP
jgi:hypothetical protein